MVKYIAYNDFMMTDWGYDNIDAMDAAIIETYYLHYELSREYLEFFGAEVVLGAYLLCMVGKNGPYDSSEFSAFRWEVFEKITTESYTSSSEVLCAMQELIHRFETHTGLDFYQFDVRNLDALKNKSRALYLN